MAENYSVLHLMRRCLRETVRAGDFCVDATAGRGRDTAFLCELAGPEGRVLAMDIQPEAIESTRTLLEEQGLLGRAELVLDSHSRLAQHASPESASCVVFNFGWLPAGDHTIFTRAQTSIPALEQALDILRPGGVMTLCIYYGRENGTEERDALLDWLKELDSARYTVLLHSFYNRRGDPPLFVLVSRDK